MHLAVNKNDDKLGAYSIYFSITGLMHRLSNEFYFQETRKLLCDGECDCIHNMELSEISLVFPGQ